jgi:signal transduction histidine kinase
MMDAYEDQEREQLLVHLGVEAARAGRLINSLLRIARLDQHEPLPLRSVDPRALVRDEIGRAARSRPHVSWGAEFVPSLPLRIECNPDALAEAVANLLDNAGRYARTAVKVGVRPVEDMVEFNVQDDGPGLPLGKVDAAFQRFVTLEPGTGTGLGLPIAQGIAEAHGGTLFYDAGSFVLRIPATTLELCPDDENGAAVPQQANPAFSPALKALIDDP